jgi:Fe-Mn family superoxide dismutase
MKKSVYLIALGIIGALSIYAVVHHLNKPTETGLYKLPPLPYAYNALEPYIDAQTMEIHHNKHHQKYVDELNATIKAHPELEKKSLEQLLTNLDAVPEAARTSIRHNGGGHYNHSFFWLVMAPAQNQEPTGKLKEAIEKEFGSIKELKEKFNAAAKKVFGSGWAWLCIDQSGKLSITTSSNQDTPISEGLTPILGLDVWEHAYYLKYQNKRPDYIDAWWHVVNWEQVVKNFEQASHAQK